MKSFFQTLILFITTPFYITLFLYFTHNLTILFIFSINYIVYYKFDSFIMIILIIFSTIIIHKKNEIREAIRETEILDRIFSFFYTFDFETLKNYYYWSYSLEGFNLLVQTTIQTSNKEDDILLNKLSTKHSFSIDDEFPDDIKKIIENENTETSGYYWNKNLFTKFEIIDKKVKLFF
jgi:hypothetical protein